MKLKRILAFLLTLALVLGALPLAVFATYTAPTAEEIQAALADEAGAGFIYANDLEGVTVTPTGTAGAKETGSTLTQNSEIKGPFFSSKGLKDHYNNAADGGQNLYASADEKSIVWKSTYLKNTNDDNNCLDIVLKNHTAGEDFVLSCEFTPYADAFDQTILLFRGVRNLSYTFIQILPQTGEIVATMNSEDVESKANDGKEFNSPVVGKLEAGKTISLAVHVKVLPPEQEDGYGTIVFDVYIDGMLKEANVLAFSEAKLISSGIYAKNYLPEYFRIAQMPGETLPYGAEFECQNKTHSTDCAEACPHGKELYSLNSIRAYYSDVCYDTVHGTNPHTLSETVKIDETMHGKICSECGYIEGASHNLSQEGYCSVCEAGIAGVSLSIDSDLAIRYHVNAIDTFTEGKALTMKVGGTVIDTYTKINGKYVFTYDGIGPHQVGDTVNATLYADGVAIDSKEYSVEKYCREALELHAGDAKLVQLVNDLLIYAKAADTYKNGSTDIAADLTLTASDYIPAKADDKLSITGNENGVVYAAGVRFDSLNKVYFKLSSESAPAVTLNGVAAEAVLEDGYYVVYSEAIAPINYNKTFTLAIGDTTVTYTVNTYAYYMQGDEEMVELATALYRYGKSCEAYITAEASCDIIYNLNEGTNPDDAPATYNPEGGTVLPTPTRDGYYFSGWYTSSDFSGEKVTEIPAGTSGEFIVYAKWLTLIKGEDYSTTTIDLTEKTATINGFAFTGKDKTGSSFKTMTDNNGNKYLEWVAGTANPIIALNNGAIAKASENTISYEIKISKNGQNPYMATEARINVAYNVAGDKLSTSNKIYLYETTKDGEIYLANDKNAVLGSIPEDGTEFTIRVAVDFENLKILGYCSNGDIISKDITIPANVGTTSGIEYKKCASTYVLYWISTASVNKTIPDASMRVGSITIVDGNMFD